MSLTRRSGFTLVELLVVVAIIAIISGMAIMLVGSATEKAALTTSMATQKQLVNQVNGYMQLHEMLLPDCFDSMIRSDYVANGASYTTLASGYSLASDPSTFMACSASPDTSGTQNINRGVDPESFSGENRTLTVKLLSGDDVSCLNSLGVTTVYDYSTNTLSHGRLGEFSRGVTTNNSAGGICIVDPQSVAGQQVYKDFGIDLSDTTAYPIKGSDNASTSWDDTYELNDAGRLAALKKQIFFVVGIGTYSKMIGDRQIGLQEAPASAVVSGGYYNRFGLVIKRSGSGGERSSGIAGVLDPKGRGPTAARAAIKAIQ